MNVPIVAIERMFRDLGLKSLKVDDFSDVEKLNLTNKQIKYIKENYPYMTQEELGKELGFTKNQIHRIVKKYNIIKLSKGRRKKRVSLFDWNGFPG